MKLPFSILVCLLALVSHASAQIVSGTTASGIRANVKYVNAGPNGILNGLAVSNALFASVGTSNTVFLGPGYYTITSPWTIPTNCTLQGSGLRATILTNTVLHATVGSGIRPSDNCTIRDFTILSGDALDEELRVPFGSQYDKGEKSSTNVLFQNIHSWGFSDALYLVHTNRLMWTFRQVMLYSANDLLVQGEGTNHVIDFFHCELIHRSAVPGVGDYQPITVYSGTVSYYNSHLESSDGNSVELVNTGSASGGPGTNRFFNTSIVVPAGAANFKIDGAAGLTLVDTPSDYEVAKVKGTVVYANTNQARINIGPGGATLTNLLSATATLDFPSTGAQAETNLTITVSGVAAGDTVHLGVPTAALTPGTSFSAWASNGVVYVRHLNASTTAKDPASGSFRVVIMKF